MSEAVDLLVKIEELPEDYDTVVYDYWVPLSYWLKSKVRDDRPIVVGVNGSQGSGKSTMCRFLVTLLSEIGLRAVRVSLDDLYLTRAEREQMAQDIHPLFATRGVPGTHDLAIGRAALDNLLSGRKATLPLFDKAIDDRSGVIREIEPPIDIVLFEGWCVGARPQQGSELTSPINELERVEDAKGTWRREVNRRLATDYAGLFRRIDYLVMLKVGDPSVVRAHRSLQERKLSRSSGTGPAVMDESALDRFLMHYERLTRHMLRELPEAADVLFQIGRDQRPVELPAVLANRD